MNRNKYEPNPVSTALLPDFCTNQTVLTCMLIGALLAIVLSIGHGGWNFDMFSYLAYASLFIQWVTLTDIAALCYLKRWFVLLSPKMMLLMIFLCLQFITLTMTEIGYQIARQFDLYAEWNEAFHLHLLGSNLIISMVVTASAIHYFYVNHQSKLRYTAETQAKIEALQARIRPHFLFNSMNTIANLVHDDPYLAEDAILDLSELFRSSLGKHDFVSLEEEISISRRYTNIERLRLDERLQVDWKVPPILPNVKMPALMLQPLVENAIYHGIEPIAEGGVITVAVDVDDDNITIKICNPIPSTLPSGRKRGNSIALKNIEQRIQLTYGEMGSMHFERKDGVHIVNLTIPIRGGL